MYESCKDLLRKGQNPKGGGGRNCDCKSKSYFSLSIGPRAKIHLKCTFRKSRQEFCAFEFEQKKASTISELNISSCLYVRGGDPSLRGIKTGEGACTHRVERTGSIKAVACHQFDAVQYLTHTQQHHGLEIGRFSHFRGAILPYTLLPCFMLFILFTDFRIIQFYFIHN